MKRRCLALAVVFAVLGSMLAANPASAVITAPPSSVVGTYDSPSAGDITVTWAPATTDNGPITYDVELRDDSLAVVASETLATTPVVFTAVGVGPFTARVVATDADPATGEASSGPIATVAAAPTIGVATATSPNEASVTFTGPAEDGGSAISGYSVTASPGGATGTGTSPVTVSGLAPETAYTFTVVAQNAQGASAASAASNGITTPAATTAPGAPTGVSASLVDDDSAQVAFAPPADDGGSGITGYTVTSSPGGFTGTGSTSPIQVDGLAAATGYTFTVTATNAVGTGAASVASNSVTTPPPDAAPGPPTGVSAVLSDLDSASVSFTAPLDNGGSDVTGYTVTSSPGGLTGTGGTSPILVDGLAAGTPYTFTVTATNSVGTGPSSVPSNSVTTVGLPDAPTDVAVVLADNTTATVTFTAPADDGGAALGDYTVTATPDDGSLATVTQTGSASPVELTGLSAGATYQITVRASNTLGASPASAAVTLVVPAVPGLAVNVVAVAQTPFSSTVTVSWDPPIGDGGADVQSYTVVLGDKSATVDAEVTEVTFTGVSLGMHSATVVALTLAGDGPEATANEIEVRAFPPFNSEEGLVRQLYVDFLGRTADIGGLTYWTGQTADDGSNIAAVARSFMFSAEFAPRRAITRLYLAFFNRRPDIGGMDFWAERISRGQANLDTISDSFVGSNEFQTTYGSLSDRDFIRLVYNNVLVRQPDQAGFDYWLAQMAAGMSRGRLMTQFSESPEFVNGTRPAVDVIVTYRGMLNRQPDDNGFAFWLSAIAGDSDAIEELIRGFYNSQEYAERITP